jgi:hypothetical protein
MNRLKRHLMPIKSIGTAPVDNQAPFRFVMEIMREPVKHRSNFLRGSRPIGGYADADVPVVSPTVTDRTSSEANYSRYKYYHFLS